MSFLFVLIVLFGRFSKENTLLTYLLGCLLNAGRVVRADIMSESGGRSKGCGTVLFETSEDAAHAIRILLTCKCGLLQCMLLQQISIPLQMKGFFFVLLGLMDPPPPL